jgi:hypothetical protein
MVSEGYTTPATAFRDDQAGMPYIGFHDFPLLSLMGQVPIFMGELAISPK